MSTQIAAKGFEGLSFCPELAQLVRSQRAVGRSGRPFEGLAALSTLNNLNVLRGLMHELKPARTLESA